MNVLIVGNGKGSYEMRGQQLGNAIGARVVTTPNAEDWYWADVAVLVKRYGAQFSPHAHAADVPIVWDALDFWKQPYENVFDETRARALLVAELTRIKPALTIGATQAMADAAGGVYVPHHSWQGLEPTEPRPNVGIVAYQGNPMYLGQWRPALEHECSKRGWVFVINPPDLSLADILVAFRNGPWDGWMCWQWKSGVKVVNAIAAGRPLLAQDTAAARELSAPGQSVATPEAIGAALDSWAPLERRQQAYERCRCLAPALRLSKIAEKYVEILTSVRATCTA